MFKNIVSSLPFSPALIGQFNLYIKKTRREESIRRLGLVFTLLALSLQFITILHTPEPANVKHPNDFIEGININSSDVTDDFLKLYDINHNNLRDILDFAGITRQEITASHYGSWQQKDKLIWGLVPLAGIEQGEIPINVTNNHGEVVRKTFVRPYIHYQHNNKSTAKDRGLIGDSRKAGWFAITQYGGNLVTKKGLEKITSLNNDITLSKTVVNTSQGLVDASSVVARANDQIRYTITIKNDGSDVSTVQIQDNLYDVLEYSTLMDRGGGTLNNDSGYLIWPDTTLEPGDKQARTFVVKIDNPIYATARGISEPASYDCIMTNVFGNATNVSVACPPQKLVEKVTSSFSKTNLTKNIIFASVLFVIVTFLYIRIHQLNKELHIIRKNMIGK
jgi:uncharacterized repeat protein (TIGR01451 family)